jgi:hypothetical protein
MLSGQLKPKWSVENCTHEIQISFLFRSCSLLPLAVETFYPRMTVAVAPTPASYTFFSLTRLVYPLSTASSSFCIGGPGDASASASSMWSGRRPAPRPQALHMPAAALVLYTIYSPAREPPPKATASSNQPRKVQRSRSRRRIGHLASGSGSLWLLCVW